MPVILDGDPGLDDAVGWLLALSSPELWVLGATVVHGNVILPLSVWNAGSVLTLAGENAAGVPYFVGADRPLLLEAIHALEVYGPSGLPAENLPEPEREPGKLHAVEFIIRTVRANPGQVTIVATGPLTNIALAFRMAPDLPDLVREVIWMGGSTTHGNRTPAAEFNALCDPHAAHIVLRSHAQVRMVGLNATLKCIATPKRVARLRALGNRAGAVCAEMLSHSADAYRERYGLDGAALHDPLAVAAAIRPDLLTWQPLAVNVDTHDGLNLGRTVCDVHHLTGETANTLVAMDVDSDAFFELLLKRLVALP